MGIFDKILGKPKEEAPNLEHYLEIGDESGDAVNPPAEFYVKRVELRNEGDASLVVKELTAKNIVVLNIVPLLKQPNRLKTIISKLKSITDKANGDMALLTPELVIITPSKVKIVKSKPKAPKEEA